MAVKSTLIEITDDGYAVHNSAVAVTVVQVGHLKRRGRKQLVSALPE